MRRVSLEDAVAFADDYFSALLAIGRRARVRTGECFLVNARHSHSALAVIDLAIHVFEAKVILHVARRGCFCTEPFRSILHSISPRDRNIAELPTHSELFAILISRIILHE